MRAYSKCDVVIHYKCSGCGEEYIQDSYYGGPVDFMLKIPKTCGICGYYIADDFKRREDEIRIFNDGWNCGIY